MAHRQRAIRQRIVRLFVRRGLLDKAEGQAMITCEHDGGFSLDTSVRSEAHDRQGREAVRKILAHLGEPVDTPCIAPAHGPPLWEAAGSGGNDLLIQPLPEYEFDQRIRGDVLSGPLTLPDGRVRVCSTENERRRAFSG